MAWRNGANVPVSHHAISRNTQQYRFPELRARGAGIITARREDAFHAYRQVGDEDVNAIDGGFLSFPAVIGHQQLRGIIELLEGFDEEDSESVVHARVQTRSVAASSRR